jgi:hypothetical protein
MMSDVHQSMLEMVPGSGLAALFGVGLGSAGLRLARPRGAYARN